MDCKENQNKTEDDKDCDEEHHQEDDEDEEIEEEQEEIDQNEIDELLAEAEESDSSPMEQQEQQEQDDQDKGQEDQEDKTTVEPRCSTRQREQVEWSILTMKGKSCLQAAKKGMNNKTSQNTATILQLKSAQIQMKTGNVPQMKPC